MRPPGDTAVEKYLAAELGLHPVAARIAAARGIDPQTAAPFFGADNISLGDPFLLPDMEEAVSAIKSAVASGAGILVYGDYDVDGITATVLMMSALSQIGARSSYYIPHRVQDGYGMNSGALARARDDGISMIITVDTGTSATAEIEYAKSLGMEVVVTDHHQVPAQLPPARAVVNPHRHDSRYPFHDLAGVAVALRLAECLLSGDVADFRKRHLDLVALGTVADVLPLVGENRLLVRQGLVEMRANPRPGIAALMNAAGRSGNIGSFEMAFVLGPRLNAAGRVAHASPAVDLLQSRDRQRVRDLAQEMEKNNEYRRAIEKEITKAAQSLVETGNRLDDRVLLVDGDDWHPGVMGIVASRMVDSYNRPVLLMTRDGDVLRGSGRSVNQFNLYQALKGCADLLCGYGGHAAAAGFQLVPENLEQLRARLNRLAGDVMPRDGWKGEIVLDGWLDTADIDRDLVSALDVFEPCGEGNPRPVIGIAGSLAWTRRIGSDGGHLMLGLGDNGNLIEGIGFGLGDRYAELLRGERYLVAGRPTIDSWRGRERIRLEVMDIRKESGATRAKLRDLYRALREASGLSGALIKSSDPVLKRGLESRGHCPGEPGVERGLKVFKELGLVVQMQQGDESCWLVKPAPRDRVDLYQSPAYLQLALGGDGS